MKKLTCVLAVAVSTMVGTGLLQGCARAGKGQYNPVTHVYDTNVAAANVVVQTEALREGALSAFDLLMRIEFTLYQSKKSPREIHVFTEDIRKNGKKYLDDLTQAKQTYQTTRTNQSFTDLTAKIAFVQSLLKSALIHITTLQTKGTQ